MDAFHILTPSTLVEVRTKKNGGYYSPNENIVLMHGLVFCEHSNRLEAIRVSYDECNQIYFVDNRIYNEFCRKHGLPIVRYARKSRGEYTDLQDESLLHMLGYNVNAKEGLSDQTRQNMLARFVELGFVEVRQIVHLLQSLIKRNGVDNPTSKEKWMKDLDFIINYKADPDRFVFISKIRRL